MLDATVDRTEVGQQASPGIVPVFQHLLGLLTQLHAQGGDGVVALVGLVTHQQQAALLGREQEHQTHHDRQSCLVELGWLDALQQGTGAVAIFLVQRLNQHFHGPAHLLA